MTRYVGVASMFLSMPMANQRLPLIGTCEVEGKKIVLHFPFTNLTFELPDAPKESYKPMTFKMKTKQGETELKIQYRSDVQAFCGQGVHADQTIVSFVFYTPGSKLECFGTLV